MLGRFLMLLEAMDYEITVGHTLGSNKREYHLILIEEETKKGHKFNIKYRTFKKIFKYITRTKKERMKYDERVSQNRNII